MKLEISHKGRSLDLAAQFREAGGDLLVFIHGLGCSKEAYDGAWGYEALNGYSLLSFDLPGFGASSRPADFSYTLEGQAAVLDQVLQQFGKYRVHLVANSWGPIIALLLPQATLTKLASFANLEGRMVIDDVGNARKAAGVSFEKFEQTFFPELKKKYGDQSLTAYRLDQALTRAYYDGAVSIVEIVKQGELPSRFTQLACPKVYVYGDQNRQLKSISVLSGVPMIEIDNAGHFMMLDNPNDFYSKLAEFLAQAGEETQ